MIKNDDIIRIIVENISMRYFDNVKLMVWWIKLGGIK